MLPSVVRTMWCEEGCVMMRWWCVPALVLVAVGGNSLVRTAMDALRPGGRVVLFAQTQVVRC